MFKIVNRKMGVRIALSVNIFLSLMIILGAFYIYFQQNKIISAESMSKGETFSLLGAWTTSAIIEQALKSKTLPEEAAFDVQYQEIPGSSPPRYHTKYDGFLEKAMGRVTKEFFKDSSVLYAFPMDINGYVPISIPGKEDSSQAASVKGLYHNLSKSFIKDLPQTDVWILSSPVFVKGKRWGSFRVGMVKGMAGNTKKKMIKLLVAGSLVFLFLSAFSIFYIVNKSLKPLGEFSDIAANLADGDVEKKIEFYRPDEIGRVAEALERLRISLEAAIERLMRR